MATIFIIEANFHNYANFWTNSFNQFFKEKISIVKFNILLF